MGGSGSGGGGGVQLINQASVTILKRKIILDLKAIINRYECVLIMNPVQY